MKPVEIKIPIFALIISGLLLVASVVVVTIIITKNKKIDNYQEQFNILEYKYGVSIKEKQDTIYFYENLIKENDNLSLIQKTKISALELKLKAIPIEVTKYTTNEKYEQTQKFLGEKTDSLDFNYSGNQVDGIYLQQIQNITLTDLVDNCRSYVYDLEGGKKLRDKEIETLKTLAEQQDGYINLCDSTSSELNKKLSKEKKKTKILGIAVPSAGVVGIVIGILVVL